MEAKPNPLVKNFQDVSFKTSLHFTNDSYQSRASLPICSGTMIAKKIDGIYLLQCQFPYRHQTFIKNFSVTGEHNLDIGITAGSKAFNAFTFVSSVVIEKDNLGDFVSKNSSGKKDINTEPVSLGIQMYSMSLINDDLFSGKMVFKKNRNSLIPMRVEIELPCDFCDQWYELFTKADYQQAEGPKLM